MAVVTGFCGGLAVGVGVGEEVAHDVVGVGFLGAVGERGVEEVAVGVVGVGGFEAAKIGD